jgi:putative DNA primase/helicase
MLLPKHLADVERSGLTAATIAAAGLRSETDPVVIRDLLHWRSGAERLGPCLVLPYPTADGAPSDYARVKPDRPRSDREKEGKLIKYESPVGQPNRPYFTPGAIRLLQAPRNRSGKRTFLLTTEGEKKSLASDQAGFPAIGLTGPWGWTKAREKDVDGHKQGPRELIDGLTAIDWRRFHVGIIWDADPRRNPSVHFGFCELARVLHEHGAEITFVELPLGARGSDGLPAKVGLDDFIVAWGEDAFRQLVRSALG